MRHRTWLKMLDLEPKIRDMDIAKETEKIIHNIVAWVEVNRQLRPQWLKENFSSMVIQACKAFRTHPDLTYYDWKWTFKSKNMTYKFDQEGKLLTLGFYPLRSGKEVLLQEINRGFRQALEEVEMNGLPSSVTQTLIDRLDRVKRLGFKEPDNLVLIDMRRLDSISFKPMVRFGA